MTTPELKVIETNAAEEFDLSRFKSKARSCRHH